MTEQQFTVRDVLVHVRELIEKGWTQGTYATDDLGIPVPENDPAACSYCLLGAIRTLRSNPYVSVPVLNTALTALEKTCGVIDHWNDSEERTQADVLRMLDTLIALTQGTVPDTQGA